MKKKSPRIQKKKFKTLEEARAFFHRANTKRDRITVLKEIIRLSENLGDARGTLEMARMYELCVEEATAKKNKLFEPIYRKARSFHELSQLLFSLEGDDENKKKVLRKIIPLSDTKNDALDVLSKTTSGSTEERLAMNRVFIFARDSFVTLRDILVKYTEPESAREGLVLNHYMNLLRKRRAGIDSSV